MSIIVREIGGAHVVWFEKSNQWVQFDEPQWFVFLLFNQGTAQEKAIEIYDQKFSSNFGLPHQVVSNIYNSVEKLLKPDFKLPDFALDNEVATKHLIREKRKRDYIFNGKPFSLIYGSPSLFDYIHKPFSHLVSEEHYGSGFEAEIFPFRKKFILRIDDRKSFMADEPSQIKRLLYIRLASFFYGINPDDWLTLIHASAVRAGNKLMVFCSPSGSGKSTMAAMLMTRNCEFVTDDFLPVDTINKRAYTFPAAVCLKEELPQQLTSVTPLLKVKRANGLNYIFPENKRTTADCRVEMIIFVYYNPQNKLNLKPVPAIKALQLFLKESWVTSNPSYIHDFLDWFEGIQFFELHFGDGDEAIEKLLEMAGEQ